MPLEKHDAVNAEGSDPETLLENDNSKDLKLTDEQAFANEDAEMQAEPGPHDK